MRRVVECACLSVYRRRVLIPLDGEEVARQQRSEWPVSQLYVREFKEGCRLGMGRWNPIVDLRSAVILSGTVDF